MITGLPAKHGVSRSWRTSRRDAATDGRSTAPSLLAAAVVTGLTAVVASSAKAEDADVAQALIDGLRVGRVRSGGPRSSGLLGLRLVVVVDVFLRRRWGLARDLLVAVLLVMPQWAPSLAGVVESDWLPVEAHVLSRWGYPELRLAAATAVLVVAGPELVRWARVARHLGSSRSRRSARSCSAPLSRPRRSAALALGLGAGALVRLAFGSAAGVPPTAQVRRRPTRARHRGDAT